MPSTLVPEGDVHFHKGCITPFELQDNDDFMISFEPDRIWPIT